MSEALLIPEEVVDLLLEWAENYQDMDIKKVAAELRYLFGEQFAEERRQQGMSGNE